MALTKQGKVSIMFIAILLIGAGLYFYKKLNPPKAKTVEVKTKATGMPPLNYDKNSNAPFRALPDYGNFSDLQTPAISGHIMEWWAQTGALYAVGGKNTTMGSICDELKVNVKLDIQNSTSKQVEDLYSAAEELHKGNITPSKGALFTTWMGDGVPAYLTPLNERIKKDFGPEYCFKVVCPVGASFGEDKWLLKPKYVKDARGSLTVAVIRDGDWNIAIIKSQLMGWPINYDQKTYDPTKVNFIAAPNDDYIESSKFYASGQKVTLKLVKNGVITGKDTTLSASGVATWFPADLTAVQQKGGLLVAASTKDFGGQMAAVIVMNSYWASQNKEQVENMIAAFGIGGDQVKSHMQALEFGAKVGKEVFASSMEENDIVKAYSSYDITDDDGNVVSIGGSHVFNLADMAAYTGVSGGSDKYKQVYNTFGQLDVEAYPEIMSSYTPYEEATDWSYLRAAFNKYKDKAGNTSKVDFKSSTKTNETVGDAAYSIEFNSGSAIIKSSSYPTLDKIFAQLNIADNSYVELSGHTDNTGSDEQNIPLSQQRAESVRQYLLSKDKSLVDRIPSGSVHGYGSTRPLNPSGDQNSKSERDRNRRVEVKLLRSKI